MALPRQWWYPACRSGELGRSRPRAITLLDDPIALFRDATGTARAVADRCPHRNVPLSIGRVLPDGCLECGYHGWRFDGTGHCTEVPGLADHTAAATRDVASFPVTERDGFVWVWGDPASAPHRQPFALPSLAGPAARIGEVVFAYDLDCTLHAALENHLDVPHTAFLHRGIFRGGTPNELTAVRRDIHDEQADRYGIEVQYLGEPVGLGNLRVGRSGHDPSTAVSPDATTGPTTFDHWDRFFLPGIAQIEYRVRDLLQIVNTVLHLPLSPVHTRAWFVVRYRTPVPAAAARPVVWARGWQIARQDVRMLAAQTANVGRFGGERYTSTDLDLMGAGIWRMLRQAERAERSLQQEGADAGDPRAIPVPAPAGTERQVTFRA